MRLEIISSVRQRTRSHHGNSFRHSPLPEKGADPQFSSYVRRN
jgi:hypothetical protein